MRRQHRRRLALERLELVQRVGVDDSRQPSRRAGGGRAPARRGRAPARSRARSRARPAARDVHERSLHRLERRASRAPAATPRRRDRDVAGVGTERRPRRKRAAPGHPARAADDEHRAGRVLVSAARLARHESRIVARDERVLRLRGRARSRRRSTSPAWNRPGATASPTFSRASSPSRRSTAAPATSPVDASTPDGMSTATTGAPERLISLDRRVPRSGRGSPWKPVPSSASITRSASPSGAPGSLDPRQSPLGLQDLARDAPVAAVRAARRRDRDRRASGKRSSTAAATPPPARRIISSTSWPASAARISSAV